jgi:hypothetical protein
VADSFSLLHTWVRFVLTLVMLRARPGRNLRARHAAVA